MSMLLCSESGRSMSEPAEIKGHVRGCKVCRELLPRHGQPRATGFDSRPITKAHRAATAQQPQHSQQPADVAA